MAQIVVLFLSEDQPIVAQLVDLLRKKWNVWWTGDLSSGDWEDAVRSELPHSGLVVAVLSGHAKGERSAILKDEMRLAARLGKPILPLMIGPGELPLGLGGLTRTNAYGWRGDARDQGFIELESKIVQALDSVVNQHSDDGRPRQLMINNKPLSLPAFVFSLSSHETQLSPADGVILLRALSPSAALVSAYDLWQFRRSANQGIRAGVRNLCRSDTVVFIDSGNYEAYRKQDHRTQSNRDGWDQATYWDTVRHFAPDVLFSFDTVAPRGTVKDVTSQIIRRFRNDQRAVDDESVTLCPIVHLPEEKVESVQKAAAATLSGVAKELDPVFIAVPERELGDGLQARVRTVRQVREALDSLGKYYPLHLLGTGNPISMIAYAAAGADAFDGLEWCRTVAQYDTGFLFHFQQFDCFAHTCLPLVRDVQIRLLLEDKSTPYPVKALSYNVDFFQDWTRTIQGMVHTGQIKILLKAVPNIGHAIYDELNA